ncbi:ATP-binding cassette, subfamily B [Anaerosporobacter mobilis DSM 15930]|uniref:ATP-binding cassette, subfamily B n=1 Tax=Anaerosporobacter mobilis DSM 15930 TaxID=1120996 RepID=A0A1M7I660_9FIRM|nr:ATP-binding cassette domain-containing protein [Anaerosporobacter mobilis]SHM36128.1 ATP-binding cassette, subfamily B [Anaerosporobacter mobilis DSM 15930]
MKSKNPKSLFKMLISLIINTFKACPIYFTFKSFIELMLGTFLALNIIALQSLFDEVSISLTDDRMYGKLIIDLIFLFICIEANPFLNCINTIIYGDFEKKVTLKFEYLFNQKCSKINPIDFENTSILDEIDKAKKGIINSVRLVTSVMDAVFIYLPYFVIVGIYLYNIKPSLIIIILVIFLPSLIAQIVKGKLFYNLEDTIAPIRREYNYYEQCITSREYFKETRILGAYQYFNKLYSKTLVILNQKNFKVKKKSTFMELKLKVITISGYLITLILLTNNVLNGSITIGTFGAVLASYQLLTNMMNEFISITIGKVMKESGSVRNFVIFLEQPEKSGDKITIDSAPEIIVDHASFNYPNRNEEAISDVSLVVHSGETVAIVGENGAGKSTFVKLISGLYLPSKGKVSIGGYDTSEIDTSHLFMNISSVFQNYQKYKISLEDNVAISDTETVIDENRVECALNMADLNITNEVFSDGYKTILSKEFDGTDLSGGQWQRIAIARGLYKNHNMILLDEPTAAIDPNEETIIYQKFKEISKGKTSFIVTHRLGAAKIADRILVFSDGQILQDGTHNALINTEGKYRDMFYAQSKWYN